MRRVFLVALRALAANKLRSTLAVLGLFVGVFSFIAMVGIGKGAETRANESIQGLGINLVFVYPGSSSRTHARTTPAETLTVEDAEAVAKLPRVVACAPEVSRSYQVKYLSRNNNVRVIGAVPEYQSVRDYQVAAGSFITKADVTGKRRVVVLGSTIARDLFGEVDPVGKTLQIDRKNFQVAGVMAPKGGQGFINLDEWVYVPLTTAQTRLMKRMTLNQIIVSLDSPDSIDAGVAMITDLLNRRHKIGPRGEVDFTVESQTDYRERMSQVTGAFTILLGGIAIVSLVVGGIGIMNIMLVSVTERTREIGIRKAVGAKDRDILKQFLAESVTISLFGGALGIVGGILTSSIVPKLTILQSLAAGEWTSEISFESILLSFGFSTAVGICFGIYPALKAAKLNPVEALRYE